MVRAAGSLVPREQVYSPTRAFHDPNLPGTMMTTVTLQPGMCDTELTIVQEGLPDMIPGELCTLGWQESLTMLAMLVEPEIPDGL